MARKTCKGYHNENVLRILILQEVDSLLFKKNVSAGISLCVCKGWFFFSMNDR